ncbi:MAG: hydroxyacid dehydrogenase [Microbacterium sp.]|jgi:phosphoglycerate dehydrogenase-like enzyme|nr:hydroxyacid dehydrogenase [Microbacterium sp.]
MPNDDASSPASLPGRAPHILLSIAPHERDAIFPLKNMAALTGISGTLDTVTPGDVLEFGDLGDIDIVVVAWGFPALDRDLLGRMPRLRLVVNAASSVRRLVTDAFWAAGIPITQSGAAMAPAVAEMSLTLTLSLLRRTHRMDSALRHGVRWDSARAIPRAREIAGARIGVIGASRTGREYVRMCSSLGASVAIHDPYVGDGDPLSSLITPLDELLATSDIVAVHAPATPETHGMLGRHELALLRDGAGLVNTARSSLIDGEALYDEVSSGRIDAALDVFDAEPLPQDDRWRALPNALLTGHVSGATRESRQRAGAIVIDEITRFVAGEPLQHRVTRTDLERMG